MLEKSDFFKKSDFSWFQIFLILISAYPERGNQLNFLNENGGQQKPVTYLKVQFST